MISEMSYRGPPPSSEESPLSLLSSELRCANLIRSAKKGGSPRNVLQQINTNSPKDRLLSSGLRVSTPPTSRLVPRRLQLVPDENNPPTPGEPSSTTLLSPPGGWKCRRTLLEDLDANSQDSGCAMSSCSAEDSSNFRFAQPCGFAPKRHGSMESPRRCLTFLSDNSQSSVDDGFLDMLGDGDEENAVLPSGLGSLISGTILAGEGDSPSPIKRPFRRCSEAGTPQRRRTVSFRDQEEFTLKRPLKDRPVEMSPPKSRLKRAKSTVEGAENGTLFAYGFWKKAAPLPEEGKPVKIHSDSEIEIKLALQRSTQEELIGDFSRPFALPIVPGKHQDLKAISSDTMARLLRGEYSDRINSYRIIDCRYPYEFKAGHIVGAENLYTCDHITKEFLGPEQPKPKQRRDADSDKRDIVIFHCEFSSERGPFLSRFLRKEDRANNEYPSLHYPEVYLLHGGYSSFFQSHRDLCDPQDYRMMQDPAHSSEFKHFKAKSKSWAPGTHKKSAMRSLSRLNY
uniref:protein-tyrosine-phosphatase n=1 Tax=Lygus hesperus TaxID=30085 RepID=A0A146LQM6_LYGHE